MGKRKGLAERNDEQREIEMKTPRLMTWGARCRRRSCHRHRRRRCLLHRALLLSEMRVVRVTRHWSPWSGRHDSLSSVNAKDVDLGKIARI